MASKKAINAPQAGTIFLMDPNKVHIIGLDTKHKAGEHELYDERIKVPVNPNLVKNMKKLGNIVPVKLRKNGKDGDGEDILEVVDGRQRVRAARQARKEQEEAGEELLCIKVMTETDADVAGVMIAANEQRFQDNPMTKARKCQAYLAAGRSQEEAAIIFGVNKKTIEGWMELLGLDKKVQGAVETGKLSASAAGELVDLPREKQVEKLEELIAKGGKITAERTKKVKAAESAPDARRKVPGKVLIRQILARPDIEHELGVAVTNALAWSIGDANLVEDSDVADVLERMQNEETDAANKKTTKGKKGKKDDDLPADKGGDDPAPADEPTDDDQDKPEPEPEPEAAPKAKPGPKAKAKPEPKAKAAPKAKSESTKKKGVKAAPAVKVVKSKGKNR